jgi:peptidoglycan-associated lipoprotein
MPYAFTGFAARRTAALAVLAVVSLAACRRKATPAPTPEPAAANDDSLRAAQQAERDRLAREQAERDRLAREASDREARIAAARASLVAPVYFDYDAADIRDDARTALEGKLPILTANTALRIRIAGHTDARGADEYNIALGQRRAAAVKRFFSERGVDGGRMDIVTFGEERGTCSDETEECHSQNRRAEFEVVSGGESLTVPTGGQ